MQSRRFLTPEPLLCINAFSRRTANFECVPSSTSRKHFSSLDLFSSSWRRSETRRRSTLDRIRSCSSLRMISRTGSPAGKAVRSLISIIAESKAVSSFDAANAAGAEVHEDSENHVYPCLAYVTSLTSHPKIRTPNTR